MLVGQYALTNSDYESAPPEYTAESYQPPAYTLVNNTTPPMNRHVNAPPNIGIFLNKKINNLFAFVEEWIEIAARVFVVALLVLAAIIVIGGALTAFVFTCIYLPKTAITVTCLAILILLELACT